MKTYTYKTTEIIEYTYKVEANSRGSALDNLDKLDQEDAFSKKMIYTTTEFVEVEEPISEDDDSGETNDIEPNERLEIEKVAESKNEL